MARREFCEDVEGQEDLRFQIKFGDGSTLAKRICGRKNGKDLILNLMEKNE